ncbi:MAG: HAD family hydrolase [Oscillospiraceae bacterium]|nr:HAD family hydrolase [Oscillospiraceae bacterium]
MEIKAVLFDLDGTLVPMDQDEFVNTYFKELIKVLCPLGIGPDDLVKAIWGGTGAMVKNDGAERNDAVFWRTYGEMTGMDVDIVRPVADAFYGNEFNRAKVIAKENPLAKRAVELAREGGRAVVLATNPLFPMTGQISRLKWVGLDETCFDFITSYETEYYCKPNPEYYVSVCKRIGFRPEECLMVGNDENEDMYPAEKLGMKCFHVTDYNIGDPDNPWAGDSGNFEELVHYLERLNAEAK